MKIQVLGTGCPKCEQLARLADEVASESGLDYVLEKVTDVQEIISFGVMMTPALAVDGEVRLAGRLPSKDEMKALLG